MTIRIQDGLPYVTITLQYRGQQLQLPNVLLDTGSAGTVFAADTVLTLGLQYEANDPVHRIRGVGGAEFVFSKQVDRLSLGDLHVRDFAIEVGAMDYGFTIDGIVGMAFLLQSWRGYRLVSAGGPSGVLLTHAWPNNRLQPTPYSVRSCVAPASRRG